MDAVGHGCDLKYQSGASEDQDGNPVIVCAVFDIDVTHGAESE